MVLFYTTLTELACFCSYKLTASFLHFQLHHFTHNWVTSDQHTPTLRTQCRIPCTEAYFLQSPWGSAHLRVTGNTLTGTACSSARSVNIAIAKSHFSHNLFRNHRGRSSFRINTLYQDWNLPPSWKPATHVAPWPSPHRQVMEEPWDRMGNAQEAVSGCQKLSFPTRFFPLESCSSHPNTTLQDLKQANDTNDKSIRVLTPAGHAHCNSISCHILSLRDQMTWSCIIKIPLNWY